MSQLTTHHITDLNAPFYPNLHINNTIKFGILGRLQQDILQECRLANNPNKGKGAL